MRSFVENNEHHIFSSKWGELEIQKFEYLGTHVRYHNAYVNTLVYLVTWLFGELHGVFTKLLVIVSFYRTGRGLRETIPPVRRKGTSNII